MYISLFSNIFPSETTWPIKAKFRVESPWEVGKTVYINGQVTTQRWPPCSFMVKPSKIFSYKTNSPMIMKLCMEQDVLLLYRVYINDDHELTLIHFKTMSNLANFVFVLAEGPAIRRAFTGPLVLWVSSYIIDFLLIFL